MKTSLVSIGNSKGIKIPNAILKHCRFEGQLDLELEKDRIVISPVRKKPRQGWDKAFKRMHERKEDELLINDSIDLSDKEWEWK